MIMETKIKKTLENTEVSTIELNEMMWGAYKHQEVSLTLNYWKKCS